MYPLINTIYIILKAFQKYGTGCNTDISVIITLKGVILENGCGFLLKYMKKQLSVYL